MRPEKVENGARAEIVSEFYTGPAGVERDGRRMKLAFRLPATAKRPRSGASLMVDGVAAQVETLSDSNRAPGFVIMVAVEGEAAQ